MRQAIILGFTVFAVLPVFALPAETITYTYDELGRLIVSSSSGGPRNGRQTAISLDPLGNRKAFASGLPLPPQTNSAIFSISGAAPIDEGSVAVFTVSKTGTAFTTMTVNFVTVNGSAVANQDYAPENATLTFLPSETVKYYGVITVSDQVAEASEQFSASLSSPSAGGSLGTVSAGATINASAGPPPPNQPPVANADMLSVTCGEYGTKDVVFNDTDPDGDVPLTLIGISSSPYAVLASATEIAFSAPYAQNASYQVIYTIRDARGATATGTLALRTTGNSAQCSGGQQAQSTDEGG